MTFVESWKWQLREFFGRSTPPSFLGSLNWLSRKFLLTVSVQYSWGVGGIYVRAQLRHNEEKIPHSGGQQNCLLYLKLRHHLRTVQHTTAFRTHQRRLQLGRVTVPEYVKSLANQSYVRPNHFLGNFRKFYRLRCIIFFDAVF